MHRCTFNTRHWFELGAELADSGRLDYFDPADVDDLNSVLAEVIDTGTVTVPTRATGHPLGLSVLIDGDHDVNAVLYMGSDWPQMVSRAQRFPPGRRRRPDRRQPRRHHRRHRRFRQRDP